MTRYSHEEIKIFLKNNNSFLNAPFILIIKQLLEENRILREGLRDILELDNIGNIVPSFDASIAKATLTKADEVSKDD